VISKTGGLEIGAQILFRPLFPGITMAYIPKGPVYDHQSHTYPPAWEKFWQQVDQYCRERGAAFLKVEPDIWESHESPVQPDPGKSIGLPQPGTPSKSRSLKPPPGFILGTHTIQPPRTLVVNLEGGEDHILSRMKQKTRYNIKLAQKRGVIAYPSSDTDEFYKMMVLTGERDGFGVHTLDYYQKTYNLFYPNNNCELIFAEYKNEKLAALMAFSQGSRAWYLYGASSNEHRDLMATYLIQWQAMLWAHSRGCTEYDLWGVPDLNLDMLEANFTSAQGGLWGVYRFKRGFGGVLRRSAGPWERIYQPIVYAAYRWRTRKHSEAAPGAT
jgi:lipid II:glycine glycyltransferase (peptidoglycan interpeptide bridge formation enzyme)